MELNAARFALTCFGKIKDNIVKYRPHLDEDEALEFIPFLITPSIFEIVCES
ncbi:hypothetical protein BpHYR1_020941 [Brachionus plicatilis]|uniref:Uncharacterized protein n=1 Tax=Brachionus plicatilis TaxID=10195 RepID=A0A3M7SID3_BRAPC|nr:hypothetical protein BpHYR1_020941 [Brachionus plicatilis]